MDNYVKTLINYMARRTGTNLTARHLRILSFAYDYYRKNRVGPLYRVLEQNLGEGRMEIENLFPHGISSVYQWVGIPVQSPQQTCKPVPEIDIKEFRDVYFDHNATTYLRKEVKDVLRDYVDGTLAYGNPSSPNRLGREAYEQVFNARIQIADSLKVTPEEIVFTASGTEANNLAIKGIALQHWEKKGHIVSDKIEHPSVLETLAWLKEIGFEVTLLDPNSDGIVSVQTIRESLRKDTILVSIMAVNNEIGTINPIQEIGMLCRERGIPLMVDGVQAFGRIPLNPKDMGISLLSVSGHKIYAPKGIGALFVDKALKLSPIIHGGHQEFGLRSGTENVGHIIAFGRAASLVCRDMTVEQKRLKKLRDLFLMELSRHVPDYIVNGSLDLRVPHNLNIGFPGIDSGALLLSLNQIGVYVSSGSACSSGNVEISHVIQALGIDVSQYGIIRFSFGLSNTEEDVAYLFQYLPDILQKIRDANST